MRNCYCCGHQIHEDAQFCPSCGAPSKPPKKKIEPLPSLRNSNNPFYWMKIVFNRCAFVEGRASRKEYFLGVLPLRIMEYIFFILIAAFIFLGDFPIEGGVIMALFTILIFTIILTASYIRRLHDIGRSGWNLLVSWLFFIPAIVLDIALEFGYGSPLTAVIMWTCYILRGLLELWIFTLMFKKGYTKDNRFGPQPIA